MAEVLAIDFTCDKKKFIVSHSKGFQVYLTATLEQLVDRQLEGGVGAAACINNSNIFALRGGGLQPAFPADQVVVWDESKGQAIAKLDFQGRVVCFELARSHLLVKTVNDVCLFKLSDKVEPVFQLPSPTSAKKAIAMSTLQAEKADLPDTTVCAFPVLIDEDDQQHGLLMVRSMEGEYVETTAIKSFEGEIECMKLHIASRQVAVASAGSIVRVFDYRNGALVKQFRREFDNAKVTSMDFSESGEWLLLSDSMGDSEIYYVKRMDKFEQKVNIIRNRRSIFGFLSRYLPLFGYEYSFAHHKDIGESSGVSRIVGRDQVVSVSMSGKITRLSFDLMNGGACIETGEPRNFMLDKVVYH